MPHNEQPYAFFESGLFERARTEHYWCPTKHLGDPTGANFIHRAFIEFGDKAGYRQWMNGRDIPR